MPTTPPANKPHVIQIAREATGNPRALPVHVRCKPMPDAVRNECFATVQRMVESNGGQQVLGWAIWEVKGMFIEAEFHAVWQSTSGRLIDVAAHPVARKEITFVVDPNRVHTGYQVDNVRRALTKDPDVQRWLDLHRQFFELTNEGDLKDSMTYEPTMAMKANKREQHVLALQLLRRYPAFAD